jgi:hypothetical protein
MRDLSLLLMNFLRTASGAQVISWIAHLHPG